MAATKTELFFEKFTAGVIRFRWLVLLGIILITAVFASQYSRLTFNSSFEIWFFEDDPAMKRLDHFKESFGNANFVYIVVKTDGVFQQDTAVAIKKMALDLEKTVPYLKDITWIGNAENIVAEGQEVRIRRIFEDIPEDAATMQQRKEQALAEKDFVGRYISDDSKDAGILLEFEQFPERTMQKTPSNEVTAAVLSILNAPEFAALDIKVVGDPVFESLYSELASKETPKIFMLCIAMQALLLFLFSRSPRGIAVPLLIVILSFLWALGSIAMLGFELDLMIIGLPVILICVSIGDSMHAIAEFTMLNSKGIPRHRALVTAQGKVGLACFVTSLTTAVAFAAFGSAPIKPILRMGVYIPLGVMYAFFLSMVLVPIIFSFGKKDAVAKKQSRIDLGIQTFADRLYRLLVTHPRKLLVLYVGVNIVFLLGATLVQIESNTARFLSKEVPLRQHMEYIDEHMGGSSGLDIVLDTGTPDGIKDVTFLKKLDMLEETLQGHPLVRHATSINDVLKKMRRAMHEGDEAYYTLPPTAQGTAEFLALYELAGGNQLNKMTTLDYAQVRINLQTKALGSKETRELVDMVTKEAKALFPAGVRIIPTGNMDIAKSLNDNMGIALTESTMLGCVLIAIVMACALRSLWLGFISLLPNILPVVATLGTMGFLSVDMDTILMTVCGMIIGVAIDDTTHFFMRFKTLFAKYGTYNETLHQTLRSIGRPLIFTTLTLGFGFLVLTCSVMVGWVRIGLLAPYAFVWALVGDLLFAGPLLLLLRPFGKEHVGETPLP